MKIIVILNQMNILTTYEKKPEKIEKKKKKKQLNNLPTGYVKTNTITNSFDRFQAKYN